MISYHSMHLPSALTLNIFLFIKINFKMMNLKDSFTNVGLFMFVCILVDCHGIVWRVCSYSGREGLQFRHVSRASARSSALERSWLRYPPGGKVPLINHIWWWTVETFYIKNVIESSIGFCYVWCGCVIFHKWINSVGGYMNDITDVNASSALWCIIDALLIWATHHWFNWWIFTCSMHTD